MTKDARLSADPQQVLASADRLWLGVFKRGRNKSGLRRQDERLREWWEFAAMRIGACKQQGQLLCAIDWQNMIFMIFFLKCETAKDSVI